MADVDGDEAGSSVVATDARVVKCMDSSLLTRYQVTCHKVIHGFIDTTISDKCHLQRTGRNGNRAAPEPCDERWRLLGLRRGGGGVGGKVPVGF